MMEDYNVDATDTVFRFSMGEGQGVGYRVAMDAYRADAIAERWNACSDVWSILEEPMRDESDAADALLRVEAILRRAIYGEE